MDLGERIRRIREDQGLSQEDLANRMDTSQSAVSQLEKGDRNPSYRTLRKLAEALGVPVSYLLGDSEGLELSPEEEAHFREYRGLSESTRQELRDYLHYLRQREAQTKGRAEDR